MSAPRLSRSAGDAGPAASVRIVLAAWVGHLRGDGAPVTDAAAAAVVEAVTGRLDEVVRRVLAYRDPALAADTPIATAVTDLAAQPAPP